VNVFRGSTLALHYVRLAAEQWRPRSPAPVPNVRGADLELSFLPLGPSAAPLFKALGPLLKCRGGDVAANSTFPSRAVYIREPTWRYKAGRRKRGGPEAERGETWRPFYGARTARQTAPYVEQCVAGRGGCFFGALSYGCSAVTTERGRFSGTPGS